MAPGSGIETINKALAGIEGRLDGIEAANRQARTALAAANLKSAIDSGDPFMSQLETFAQNAGAGTTTDELRDFAADGVPTEQVLTNQWPDVRDEISKALTPSAPGAPVGDQFMAGLRSLVQVRPTGPAPASAEGPKATLSRLDAAIQSGNLAAWQKQWQTLPDPARKASKVFADRVAARLTAQRAVAGALSAALKPTTPAASQADPAEPNAERPAAQGNQG